jgi:hypothetical protein
MKRHLSAFAALAMSLLSSALVPSLKASESGKKTIIWISQPVSVQGTVLPAGQYVLRLLDSPSNLGIVRIFNGEGTRLITMVPAIHAYRPSLTGESEFKFYDTHEGQPAALHTWFYPGDSNGFEFLPGR